MTASMVEGEEKRCSGHDGKQARREVI